MSNGKGKLGKQKYRWINTSRRCGENYRWSNKEKGCVRVRGYKGEVPKDIMADIIDRLNDLAKRSVRKSTAGAMEKLTSVAKNKSNILKGVFINKI